jgi:hypothetical protein
MYVHCFTIIIRFFKIPSASLVEKITGSICNVILEVASRTQNPEE